MNPLQAAILSGLIATAAWLPMPAIASNEGVEVGAGTNEFNAGLETSTSSTSSSDTATAGQSAVSIVPDPVCIRGEGSSSNVYYGCGSQATCGTDGLLYNLWAVTNSGAVNLAGTWCDDDDQATPANVLTPGRILEAFRRVEVPSAPIGVNPVGGRTLVNFDTILHTQAQPFTATVQLLGRRVTFDIEPAEFTWRTGQGDGFTTSDPGQPYREALPMSAYVTHRYLRAGTVQLGLDTTWTARWRVGDGPWRPVDGTVITSSDPVALEVVTARPQLVSYD